MFILFNNFVDDSKIEEQVVLPLLDPFELLIHLALQVMLFESCLYFGNLQVLPSLNRKRDVVKAEVTEYKEHES